MLRQCCTGTELVLCQYGTDTVPVRYWYCTGIVPVLRCTGTPAWVRHVGEVAKAYSPWEVVLPLPPGGKLLGLKPVLYMLFGAAGAEMKLGAPPGGHRPGRSDTLRLARSRPLRRSRGCV